MNHIDQESDNNGIGCTILLVLMLLGSAGLFLVSPHFLSSSTKAYEAEAKNYIGAMNRAQQAYFFEKNDFGDSLDALEIGIKNETKNYLYKTVNQQQRAINYGISKSTKYKSYVGGVFIVPDKTVTNNNQETQKTTIVAILCEGKGVSITKLNPPKLENNQPLCAEGTKRLY